MSSRYHIPLFAGLLVATVFGITYLSVCCSGENPPKGTTEHIKDVFIGRCWDYQITRYKDVLPRVQTNCTELWRLFSRAFAYLDPCNVSKSNYRAFFAAASQELPANKSMFWSRVFSLAHSYNKNGQRFITIEDTLIGYLLNGLNWCGMLTIPGINYRSCPIWDFCPLQADKSFWAGASIWFASSARGDVNVMLDGSNPDRPAYSNKSMFYQYELPNLSDKVTSITVMLSHSLHQPKRETCEKGSLLQLEADVKRHNIPYRCVDDPMAVMHLLCADDPTSPECRLRVNTTAWGLRSDL